MWEGGHVCWGLSWPVHWRGHPPVTSNKPGSVGGSCIPRNWDPSRENGCGRGVTSAGACPGRYIGGVTPQSLPINRVRWVDPCIRRNWDPSRENGCGRGVTSAGACPGRYIGGATPQPLPINRHVPGKLLGSGRISYMLLKCGRTNVWKPWDRFSEQQQSHEQIIPIQSSENRAGRVDPCIPRNWDPSRETGCGWGVTSAGACPGRYIGGLTPQPLPINRARWVDPCIPRNWDPSRETGCGRGVTSAGACPGRYIGGVTPQSLPINRVRWVHPCLPRNWDPSRETGCGWGVTSAGACPGRYIGGVTPQSLPINRVRWVDPVFLETGTRAGKLDVGGGSRLLGPVLDGTLAGSPPSHFQ